MVVAAIKNSWQFPQTPKKHDLWVSRRHLMRTFWEFLVNYKKILIRHCALEVSMKLFMQCHRSQRKLQVSATMTTYKCKQLCCRQTSVTHSCSIVNYAIKFSMTPEPSTACTHSAACAWLKSMLQTICKIINSGGKSVALHRVIIT